MSEPRAGDHPAQGRNRHKSAGRRCSAVGYLQVVRLRRSAEGPVKLGMLQPGEYRELKKSEINALRNAAMKSAGKGESRAARPGIPLPATPWLHCARH